MLVPGRFGQPAMRSAKTKTGRIRVTILFNLSISLALPQGVRSPPTSFGRR
jgi:hypothetical protein